MQFEIEVSLWMSEHTRLEDITERGRVPVIWEAKSDMSWHGYIKIGTGKVTGTLFDLNEVVQGQVKALEQALAQERAASQQRQNFILDQISKLQALTYEPV